MTNYNDGKWHGWSGGECPVHPDSVVEFLHKSDYKIKATAGDLVWGARDTGIVAFRVVKERKVPREAYFAQMPNGGIWLEVTPDHKRAVKFREVIE